MAADGIIVRVMGDYGPFSTMGKSIGYQVTIGGNSFLIDCGSPLFQQIGGHGLKDIKGLIITHCHDDHKRWFTDLSLFCMYAPDIHHKLPVYTSNAVNKGLQASSGPALNSSLSGDSRTIIDHAYDEYIDFRPLGPRAKYCIERRDIGAGGSMLVVVDACGGMVGPERAKIVVSTKNGTARLLFKDHDYGEWIEPENFYPFTSTTFYGDEQRILGSDAAGFMIEAINAPVWHGVTSIGLRFRTATETLVFSADTVHDIELWQALHTEKRPQRLTGSRDEFETASIIYGDINDYIERIWSRERYHEALTAFADAIVIHDIATRKSVVHTDYRRLGQTMLKKELTILTHSPDKMTSEWALSRADKTFLIQGRTFREIVGTSLFPMDAAVYHKEAGRYYVGYWNPDGNTTVYENNGDINLGGEWYWENGTELYKVDIYEDIGGKYFPKLEKEERAHYVERADGRVERVTYSENGSSGVVVENLRGSLAPPIVDRDAAN